MLLPERNVESHESSILQLCYIVGGQILRFSSQRNQMTTLVAIPLGSLKLKFEGAFSRDLVQGKDGGILRIIMGQASNNEPEFKVWY